MLILIAYFIIALVVAYIHAHGCYIKGIIYPWKEDFILCALWPIVLPFGNCAIDLGVLNGYSRRIGNMEEIKQ